MEDVKFKHYARIIRGTIVPEDLLMWQTELSGKEGKEVVIIIYDKEELKPIDKSDISYYFGGLIKHLCHHDYFLDHNPKAVHHALMKMFWEEILVIDDKEVRYTPSITIFNKRQFSLHCEKVMHFAAETLGIELYDRHQYYTAKRYRLS